MYTWNWNTLIEHVDVLLMGALLTVGIASVAFVLGVSLGCALALLERSRYPFLRRTALVYVDVMRSVPILVLLIWLFYVTPLLLDVRLSPTATALLALTLSVGAYSAEIIRAGLEAIPKHQYESARALGLSFSLTLRHIIAPQGIPITLPALIGLFATTLKDTSLASIIAVNELLHRGNVLIAETFRPLEIYTAVACIYMALILPMLVLARRYENRLHLSPRLET